MIGRTRHAFEQNLPNHPCPTVCPCPTNPLRIGWAKLIPWTHVSHPTDNSTSTTTALLPFFAMPRLSERAKRLLERKKRLVAGIRLRMQFIDSDSDESLAEELDFRNGLEAVVYQEMKRRRYTVRGPYRKPKMTRITDDLGVPRDDGSPGVWLNDNEFLQKYRMTRDSFGKILRLIEKDPVFQKKSTGKKQAPVAHQLMVLLNYLGTEGAGASSPSLRNVFGVGKGTIDSFKLRAATAINNLHDKVIVWPNARERRQISRRIEKEFQWKHCVGFMDGTLFPLRFKPKRLDAPDYSGRKHAYSLSALIICDDQKLIRTYTASYPGTWHDNRIFRTSDIVEAPAHYFAPLEYLLTDSAFQVRPFVIPAYRKPPGGELPRDKTLLNNALACPRVESEHVIGIVKGRFPWLRSIPNEITEDETSFDPINLFTRCCFILHNLLIQHKDHVDEAFWAADLSEFDDIDDPGGLKSGNDLDIGLDALADATGINRPLPEGAHPGLRREQHCSYMRDSFVQYRNTAWRPRKRTGPGAVAV
jgi:DDE superfamily endonuclease